jgi:hypothetical protein
MPALANGDPTPAVVLVSPRVRVLATVDHAEPRQVKRMPGKTVCALSRSCASQGVAAIRGRYVDRGSLTSFRGLHKRANYLSVQTPTRFRRLTPAEKIGQPHLVVSTAIAVKASPAHRVTPRRGKPEFIGYYPSAEPVPRLNNQSTRRLPSHELMIPISDVVEMGEV